MKIGTHSYIPICFCGSPTKLMSSKEYYGKGYGTDRYVCVRFPECRGSVGTHPNGEPLGSIPDEATKNKRMLLHSLIEILAKLKEGEYEIHSFLLEER